MIRLASLLVLSLVACATPPAPPSADPPWPKPPVEATPEVPQVDLTDGLSLREALSLALDRNARLLAARSGLGVAKARQMTADQWPNNPVLFGDVARGLGSARDEASYRVGLSQAFRTGGQGAHQVAVADANMRRAEAIAADAARLIQAEVKQAFVRCLSLRARSTLVARNAEVAGKLLDAAKARFQAKQIPEVELNLVRLDKRRAQNQQARLALQKSAALVRLSALLGRPAEALNPVGDLAITPSALTDRDAVLALARERRPDLLALRRSLEMAQLQVGLERARSWPDLGVGVFYEREATEFAGVVDRDNVLGIELSLPLPFFHRRGGERAEALAQVQVVEAELRAALSRLELNVDLALSRLTMAGETVKLYETGLQELSRQNLRQFERAYRAGEVGTLAVLRARDDLNRVALGLQDALLEHHTARIDLETLVGRELWND